MGNDVCIEVVMKKDDIERLYGLNLCQEIVLPLHPVQKPKYQFSRTRWYSIDIPVYSLWRLGKEYNEIIEWCNKYFGPHPKKHDAWSRWWVGLGVINFRDEKDYVLFTLRWGA
jgi:hypothetical protein